MLVDIEQVLYWIEAIRESSNPIRTMDSFYRGQINSKLWLAEELGKFIDRYPVTIDIFGGWTGVLASVLFHQPYAIKTIRSVDIDPSCEKIANMMNENESTNGRFIAVTGDMCTIRSDAEIAINTSCEHITQEQYEEWLTCLPYNSLIVLQSNNYKIPEHVRIAESLEEFKNQSKLTNILYAGELKTQHYTRWMLIGERK